MSFCSECGFGCWRVQLHACELCNSAEHDFLFCSRCAAHHPRCGVCNEPVCDNCGATQCQHTWCDEIVHLRCFIDERGFGSWPQDVCSTVCHACDNDICCRLHHTLCQYCGAWLCVRCNSFCGSVCRMFFANKHLARREPNCAALWRERYLWRTVDIAIALAALHLPVLIVYKIVARCTPPIGSAVPRYAKMQLLEAVHRKGANSNANNKLTKQ